MFVSEIAARMSEFEALQLLSKWLEEEDYFSEEDRDALHEFKIGCIVRLLEEGKIKMTKIIGRNSEVMDAIKEAIASPDSFDFLIRPNFEDEFNLEVQEVEDEYYFDLLSDLSNNQLKVSELSIEENCIALEAPSQEKIEQCFKEVENTTKMFVGEAGSGDYGSSAFRRWTKSGITLDELRRYASLCEKIIVADSLDLGREASNAAIAQLSKAYQKLSKEWRNPVNIPDGWVEVGFDEYVEGMCSDTDSEIAWFESLTGLKADYDYNVNMTAYAESAVHEDKREQLFGLFKLLASGSVNAQTACSQLLDIGYDLSEIGLSESAVNS